VHELDPVMGKVSVQVMHFVAELHVAQEAAQFKHFVPDK